VEDDILMQRAAGGDRHAFRLIVERHGAGIYNYFVHSTGSIEDAEDLTQQCFINLYRSLGRYRKTAALRTFIFRIAHNLAVSHSRRKAPPLSLDLLLEQGYDLPAQGDDPDELAAADELQRAYRKALAELPAEWRSIVELRVGRELVYREIAAVTGRSEAAVESILFRARERLSRRLAAFRGGSGRG